MASRSYADLVSTKQAPSSVLFSLVVATLGRTDELRRFLSLLPATETFDFEVIIVDQNEDSRIDVLLRGLGLHFPIVHLKSTKKNASAARNQGAASARGTWLAFPDDDCCYTSDTLHRVKQEILKEEAEIITGIITDFQTRPFLKKAAYSRELKLSDAPQKFPEPAIFIHVNTFRELKGFNENLGPGTNVFSGEGMDLGFRAIKSGKSITFNPKIRVMHPRKLTRLDKEDNKKMYQYAFGNLYTISLHHRRFAYFIFSKQVILFLPRVILKPRRGKLRHFICFILGLYDGTFTKKTRHLK